jgi:Leucine-rich repeat (LRR) protein
VLAQLPLLHTVDFSSCCQPLPAGHLGKVLVELSALNKLETLQLSTWALAQAPSTASHAANPAGQLQDSPHADGGPSAVAPAHAGFPAAAAPTPQYDVMLPTEVARMTNLQKLVISTCPEVTAPFAQRLALPAGLMQLPCLTKLELHGFLPPVHHLRGLKHLQHLAIIVPQCSAEAATADAAGGHLQQSSDAINAAKAAVQSLPGLTSLHVQLSARQIGHLLDPTSIVVGVVAGEILELLSAASTAAHPAPACRLRQLRLTQAGGLYHLPARFVAACSGLQELDLSCSRLTVEAVAVLGGLTGLTSLCLSESSLHEVPASWAGLTQLQVCGSLS